MIPRQSSLVRTCPPPSCKLSSRQVGRRGQSLGAARSGPAAPQGPIGSRPPWKKGKKGKKAFRESYKPRSVSVRLPTNRRTRRRRPLIWESPRDETLTTYPGVLTTRATSSSPIWSLSEWGLPSQSGHPVCWCALTAPFHPYPHPRMQAVYFLLHFPYSYERWELPTTLP